jgi:hypothetical protein
VEAKHRVEAVRIQREQLERSYRQDMSGLHDRIAILRRECEEEVARARLEWERKCAIERGEAVEADEEEEGEGEEGEMEYDEEGQTEVGSADSAPTETWSLNDYDHDHSSTFPLVGSARPAMLAPLAPPPLQRLRRSPLFMAVPSSLGQPEVIESGGPSTSHGLPPLRRQPAQLLPFTFVSGDPATMTNTDSGGDDDDGRTDQDSEMGEA